MGTATSRAAALGFATLALAAAGCGGGARRASGFGWLRPGPPPAGWHAVRIPSGSVLSYPPSWRHIAGDRGTATAVSRDRSGHIVGYLNLTPRQGDETLAGWSRFRPEHNAEEGDKNVRTLATATGLSFRSGRGNCVEDSYSTTDARYIELACLVRAGTTSSVVVGASTPAQWTQIAPLLERSISALTV